MLSFVLMRMFMGTTLRKKPMRMIGAIMQNFIHDNINDKATSSSDKHNHRLLHEFLINDAVGRFIEHKEN